MINQSDIEKLKRFSKGLSTVEEERYIHDLFSENEGSKGFKYHLQKEFNEFLKNNPEANHNLSYLLDRIHHTIHKNENQKIETVVRKIYHWYSAAAAVILIPLLIVGTLWITGQQGGPSMMTENPVTSTLFAPLGSRISFSLPDGTQGWLNSGSSIKYQIPFSNNRQIALLGEAWFDVAHDANHPFEIAAGDSKVKVLGTKFNLNAYPEDKYVEVVLAEGKVEFFIPGCSSGVEMKPDERLVMSDGVLNINQTDASKYAAWIEGKLVFREDAMGEVVRRIERWYNVEIELVDKKLEDYVFRGTFQDNSLEEVFRYLSMTSPIRYKIVDCKILKDGTVQKRKVFLYRDKNKKSI